MFSVILSTIGLVPSRSLIIPVDYSVTCYSAVGTHPTGMFSRYDITICEKHFYRNHSYLPTLDLVESARDS